MTSYDNSAYSDGRCLDQKALGDLDRRTRLCAACKRPARLTVLDESCRALAGKLRWNLVKTVVVETHSSVDTAAMIRIDCGGVLALGEVLASESRDDKVHLTIRIDHILTNDSLAPSFKPRPSA